MESTDVSRPQSLIVRDAAAVIAVAGAVFALAYANGGFFPTTRSYAGIAAWWLLGVGAAIGVASAWAAIDRMALAALGLFAAFAIWILISTGWASDAERAFAQFNQVSLYVAVLAIAIVLARLLPARVLVGGVALAVSAIAAVALVSRFFPSTFGVSPGSQFLPPLKYRLSFPLGYWNGLGIEIALAYPLLLSIMTSRRSRIAGAVAALPLPLLGAVMYLTSSRGAFAAAAVGVVALLVLTPKRWPALAAVVMAGIAGGVAIAVLVPKKELVNGQMRTALGVHQGHQAALWLGIACVVTALVWAALAELGTRLPTPSRRIGQVTAVVLVVLAVAAIALAHPIAKFDNFKRNPTVANTHGTETTSHLLNSSGSGRWQFWGAAVSEFRAHPLNGGGAGSWRAWWLQHNSLKIPSEFAHSLYLESLAELGIVGLLLIAAAVLTAVTGAVRSALALASTEVAAAAACGLAFFVAAAYDWVWQLAGVAVVGVGMLGVALGALPATRATAWGRAGIVRPAIAVLAVAAIIPQFVVLAAGSHLRNSQDAFYAGDAERARSEALAAKAIEPWAASPYLWLALTAEGEGNYKVAARWVDDAISHSRRDYQLWLRAAIIEAKSGNALAAKRDLDEARRLNPYYHRFLQQGP
ncbi:MAG TPA: O-antigen ligase family protein [Gaiellaceae bacterium]|nr:O-antigen ligase family protein [Gaiellaceae bacterium]